MKTVNADVLVNSGYGLVSVPERYDYQCQADEVVARMIETLSMASEMKATSNRGQAC